MKKVILSMMLGAAMLVGGNAMAQTPADGTTGATKKTEQAGKGKACDNCQDQKCQKGPKANKGPKFNPFDGIQLTDDQQQRLQVLQQGLGPVKLSKEQQAKIPQNPNLTPEQKKQLKEERKAQKLQKKKDYLAGVKEILTPDQYVVFLENVYLYSPQEKGKSGHKGNKEGKHKNKKK